MTRIPLTSWQNYISFPDMPTSNVGDILTDLRNTDPTITLQKYDTRISDFVFVNDYEFIEKGVGYILDTVAYPVDLTYSGTPYTITFDQLKSRIIKGFNLISTGSNTLTIPNWCKITDPSITDPYIDNTVTQLQPTKAYWVYYDDCISPVFDLNTAITIFGTIGTILFTYYLLGKFRIIGKPID